MPRTKSTETRTRTPRPDPTQVVRLFEYSGKFLAWSEDFTRVVAVGDSYEQIRHAAREAGHVRFISEWVPPADERQTTGFE